MVVRVRHSEYIVMWVEALVRSGDNGFLWLRIARWESVRESTICD